ncbi:MAG: hypothetical protein LBL51_02880, partial [Synergistaceae bacterium]|nr:hypothetical protein [Synergistaceae bacterium]
MTIVMLRGLRETTIEGGVNVSGKVETVWAKIRPVLDKIIALLGVLICLKSIYEFYSFFRIWVSIITLRPVFFVSAGALFVSIACAFLFIQAWRGRLSAVRKGCAAAFLIAGALAASFAAWAFSWLEIYEPASVLLVAGGGLVFLFLAEKIPAVWRRRAAALPPAGVFVMLFAIWDHCIPPFLALGTWIVAITRHHIKPHAMRGDS